VSEQPEPIDPKLPSSLQIGRLAASANQPPSFWIASLASLAIIVGGVGPWATYLHYVSISGTSMDGWREVAVGAIALGLLGVYQVSGWRLPVLVVAILAVLGVIGAIEDLSSITSGGALTVFGITYRYLTAAWGIYLVLAGTIILALSAFALLWDAALAWGGRFRSAPDVDAQQP
jgi:hypothetical protein